MIDVVFVVMLFFMVMAGALKAERQLSQKLPGGKGSAERLPVELSIGIDQSGQLTVNDEPVDSAGSKALAGLHALLRETKKLSRGDGSMLLVMIEADAEASYERIVDVLNALSAEQIQDVSFGLAGDL